MVLFLGNQRKMKIQNLIWSRTFLQILSSLKELLTVIAKDPSKMTDNIGNLKSLLNQCDELLDTLGSNLVISGISKNLKATLAPIINSSTTTTQSLESAISAIESFISTYKISPKQVQELLESHWNNKSTFLLKTLIAVFCGYAALGIPNFSLPILGFTTNGIVRNSFGAWLMSTYGGYVPAGSLVGILQSAAATGAVSVPVSSLIAGVGALLSTRILKPKL